jgi:hypothetical protein
MQYVMESIFANFDEKKWEEEFLRERGKKIYETLGKHYTLTDFFGKKCREALDVEPLATFIRFLESRHVTPSREGLIFELIKNFDDGVFHIPHLQKLATSDEDLKKRIRLLMHTNSGSRLYTKLLNAAEGHSYFWKSLRELLADSPSFTDQELKLACESGVLANARGEMPTGTCPVHHLPQETFDGIIDLMVKYPESSANQ